jgi:hypothetical protein
MKQPIYCDACRAAGEKTISFKKVKLQNPVDNSIMLEHNFCEKCYLNFLEKMNADLDNQIAIQAIKKSTSNAGKAGTGESKSRGNSDYYSNLSKKRKPANL